MKQLSKEFKGLLNEAFYEYDKLVDGRGKDSAKLKRQIDFGQHVFVTKILSAYQQLRNEDV